MQQVIDGMTVTIPDAMVENQLDGLIAQLRGQLEGQGATLEQYLEYSGTTMEQLREHAREQAATAARYELAMTEIARREGIEITEEELEQQYGAPALRLRGKGVLAQGADADVCVFDPEKLHERGTYQLPRQTAEGMTLVLVNGQAAVRDGQLTGVMAGRAIRR